jgi:hypothetical protein
MTLFPSWIWMTSGKQTVSLSLSPSPASPLRVNQENPARSPRLSGIPIGRRGRENAVRDVQSSLGSLSCSLPRWPSIGVMPVDWSLSWVRPSSTLGCLPLPSGPDAPVVGAHGDQRRGGFGSSK